jgi:methionyl-tRNA formyltransferase
MKAIFLGQGGIAAACLKHYTERSDIDTRRIVGLVVDSVVRDAVESNAALRDTPIRDCASRNEPGVLDLIKSTGADLLISVQYPWILSGDLLDRVSRRALNLHNARLPDYRGHNSMTHVILNGDTEHTVTLHWMAPVVDRGEHCLEGTIPIAPDETALSLWEKSRVVAVRLFARLLDEFELLVAQPRRPIEGVSRYYHRDSWRALKRLLDDADLATIDRYARAFHFPPHEPAYFEHPDGRRTYVVPSPIRLNVL